MTRFQAIIHFLTLGLAFAKADPADKAAIAALNAQKQDLQRQLDAAKEQAAQAPSSGEASQIDELLEMFRIEVSPHTQNPPDMVAPVGGESDIAAPLPNGNGTPAPSAEAVTDTPAGEIVAETPAAPAVE